MSGVPTKGLEGPSELVGLGELGRAGEDAELVETMACGCQHVRTGPGEVRSCRVKLHCLFGRPAIT